MKQQLKLAGLATLFAISANAAVAQEKLRIGLVLTLSGPAAALGQQVRDGFNLAVKTLGGNEPGKQAQKESQDECFLHLRVSR